MYSDEVEESLNEEIIKIIMQDQSSENIEPVRMITPIPPQRPPEMVILSNTPSPRCSPYPSPSHSPYPSPFHSPCPSPRPSSPLHSINGLKTSNQTEKLSPSTAINSQRYTPAPEHVQPLQTKPHGIACDSKKPTSNPSADVQEEDSKKTEKNSGPKFDSSTSSSSKAAIFRSRLFGLQYTGASESPTLPPTSKATSSNNACTTSSSNTSNLYLFAEPPMSPATISNSPFPPSEPLELQYFECDEVKMRHLVNKMSHANVCPADTCTELCVYIKWYANHRKSCTKLYNKGKCEHCHKFIQWQYQHCINCKCFPHKGCSDNISWCPQIKQSILKNKLESCIAPLVRKLQNGFHLDKENSCPRHNTIEKCHPEGYHEVLKEHLQFNVGGGMFVEGKHWKRNKRAGRGRSGSCWIAELIECPFYFAVKEARLDSSTQAKRNLDEAYCSVKMKYLNQHVCPNIIDYYGFTTVRLNAHPFVEPPPMLLQIHMELMACCLQSFVTDKDKNGPLLFDKVVDFSYQLFSALDFLHSNLRILHRDIKPGNILVAHNEQRIKLTDFDCAALLDEWNLCDVFQGDPQGTVHYNPPELYCRGQYSWSLDVWQVACCVLFMCTGCRPWRHAYFNCDVNHHNRNCFMHSITKKISAYLKHLLPGFLPPTLHTLLSQCLHSDWKNRLTPLDAMYMLDSDLKSRNKLLSSHDITGSPCGISAATPMAPVQNDNSQPIAVDIYLAEYTERMPELYLQPGWIASLNLPHNKTITYGDLKSLIYDSTELEVMKYLKNCDFYIYKNDRIKIRDLLIKELTLEQFSKMNDSDIVDPDNAVIMRYMDSFYP